jgi:hypothetical protein
MPAKKPHSKDYEAISQQYIADVLGGKQPACKWVKLACERRVDEHWRLFW